MPQTFIQSNHCTCLVINFVCIKFGAQSNLCCTEYLRNNTVSSMVWWVCESEILSCLSIVWVWSPCMNVSHYIKGDFSLINECFIYKGTFLSDKGTFLSDKGTFLSDKFVILRFTDFFFSVGQHIQINIIGNILK